MKKALAAVLAAALLVPAIAFAADDKVIKVGVTPFPPKDIMEAAPPPLQFSFETPPPPPPPSHRHYHRRLLAHTGRSVRPSLGHPRHYLLGRHLLRVESPDAPPGFQALKYFILFHITLNFPLQIWRINSKHGAFSESEG